MRNPNLVLSNSDDVFTLIGIISFFFLINVLNIYFLSDLVPATSSSFQVLESEFKSSNIYYLPVICKILVLSTTGTNNETCP